MSNFLNINKMIKIGESSWSYAKDTGLIDMGVSYSEDSRMDFQGHEFINMCSCSYLGLDTHPEIIEGGIEGLQQAKSLHLTTARIRLYSTLLGELEEALSEHYKCYATSYISCSAASFAYLPILASGMLTNDVKPTMIFDKQAHFSMLYLKPICGDQTEVLTCPHNDIEFIEEQCKKKSKVAYVCDGTYSVSGHTPVKVLFSLQETYGLIIYFDDSHGLSVTGERGEGFIRENIPELNEQTIVVGSLAKAFGACGGVLMAGSPKLRTMLVRYGTSWSQYLNSAGIGAIKASLKIHKTSLLHDLQASWRRNLTVIDRHFSPKNQGVLSPIRIILLNSAENAIQISKEIFNRGYYVSAVFFPIVPQGKAGLRIMPRADVSEEEMNNFCLTVKNVCGDYLI